MSRPFGSVCLIELEKVEVVEAVIGGTAIKVTIEP
jgi:hypothetical protein